MKLKHKLYFIHGELYKTFVDSNWYDTATPAQYCIRELTEIWRTIESGRQLIIESDEQTFEVKNLSDFREWLKNTFKGGFENFEAK